MWQERARGVGANTQPHEAGAHLAQAIVGGLHDLLEGVARGGSEGVLLLHREGVELCEERLAQCLLVHVVGEWPLERELLDALLRKHLEGGPWARGDAAHDVLEAALELDALRVGVRRRAIEARRLRACGVLRRAAACVAGVRLVQYVTRASRPARARQRARASAERALQASG